MKDVSIKKGLAFSILVVLFIILLTPFVLIRKDIEFTHTPIIRIDYVDNKTVYDVQSPLDYHFDNMTASVSWTNESGIQRQINTIENAYILIGKIEQLQFNLTLSIVDNSLNSYKYMGDFNITKITVKGEFYLYMNITEHSEAWPIRYVSRGLNDLPYKVSLELNKKE